MVLESFRIYLKLVEAEFLQLKQTIPNESLSLEVTSVRQAFLARIELLENRKEFATLASQIAEPSFGKYELQAFFRCSGIYEAAFFADSLPFVDLEALYKREFEASETEVTTLTPIEYVRFSSEMMEFDTFIIRRFSKSELNGLLRQPACNLYYPWAKVDINLLAEYWFIVTKEKVPIQSWDAEFTWYESVRPTYSPFSGTIKQAFRVLILYKWQERGRTTIVYPRVSLTIRTSNSLRERPRQIQGLSQLSVEPIHDNSGEEVGEIPLIIFSPSEYEPPNFYEFAQRMEKLITTLENEKEWRFIETALNFLEKGFIQEGLDQLLWHITTIEALLGEKMESGLTALLKNRVGRVLGKTEKEQKDARRTFQSLYDLRSDYIHGNASLTEREILHRELMEAREVARSVTVWMLFYLNHVWANRQGATGLPSRENLLAVLDMDVESRNQMAQILSALPEEFPKVSSWLA